MCDKYPTIFKRGKNKINNFYLQNENQTVAVSDHGERWTVYTYIFVGVCVLVYYTLPLLYLGQGSSIGYLMSIHYVLI